MMRKKWFSLLCILVTLQVLGAVAVRAQAPAAPAPAAGGTPGLENAIVTISVGDLPGFLNNFSTVAAKIQPTMTAESFKALIGGQFFGDPQLQGFAPGTGMAVVVLPPNTMLVFAQVAPAQRDAYLQAAKMKAPGTVVAGDLLATSSDPTMANLATQLAPAVKNSLLTGAGKPTVKVSLNSNMAATMLEGILPGLMQNIAAAQQQQKTAPAGLAATPEAMQAQQQILDAEVRVFVSLLKQLKTLDLEVAPANGDLGLTVTFNALPDTNLAKLFAAPTKPVTALMQMTPGKGAFRMVSASNGPELRKAIQTETDAILAQMQLTEETKKSVKDMIEMSVGTYGDGFALDMCIPGAPLMSGTMIYADVEDPQKVLTMLQTAPEKMQGFLKMYEQMGMPMQMNLQMNVRQHKNLPIHRFNTSLQVTNAPAEIKNMMDALMGPQFGYDLAVVDKKIVYSMGGEKVEEMIDALLAGKHPAAKPFKAQEVFGNDQQLYADLDVATLVKSVFGIVQKAAPANAINPQMNAQVEAMFAGAEPITLAGRSQGTQFAVQAKIPGTVITGIGQAGMMVFQQIMMAQQQAAAGMAAPTTGTEPTTGTAPEANQPTLQPVPATPANPPAAPAQPAEKADPFAQSEKDLRGIAIALESYRIDNKRYPDSLEQLSQKVTYFKSIPADPFSTQGEPYHYTVADNGNQWTLWSVGPDGTNDEAQVPYDPAQGAAGKGDIVRSSVRTK